VRQDPLRGISVLDFTQILAGPFCTQLLADAGATILKVEPPGGELSRARGPQRNLPDGNSLSSYSGAVNRGKRSIVLDLKNPWGVDIARQLLATVDVVVENFLPGKLAGLGIDLGKALVTYPRLVALSISLYGDFEQAGSLASRRGVAIVAEAEGSTLAMTRDDNGTPVMPRMAIGDMVAGFAAYSAVVTALLDRAQSGCGQHIQIPMVPALLALNASAIVAADIVEDPRQRDRALRTAAYGIFPTNDGYVAIGCNSDRLFTRLCVAIDQAWMLEDSRFNHYSRRDEHVDEVDACVQAWTAERRAIDVVAILQAHEIPCGRVNTPADVLDNPDFDSLGYLERIDDGYGGTIHAPRNPLGLHQPSYAIPLVGEHSIEILSEVLGLKEAEIGRLKDAGAFGQGA
jgi:formyl-CoA transferase